MARLAVLDEEKREHAERAAHHDAENGAHSLEPCSARYDVRDPGMTTPTLSNRNTPQSWKVWRIPPTERPVLDKQLSGSPTSATEVEM